MDHNQILVVALATVPTMITVLIGILLNNSRLNDMQANMNARMSAMDQRMASIEQRLNHIENRLTQIENKFDTRFDLLISKVVEIDNRLTRLEAQRR